MEKTVFITGCDMGLGLSLARRFYTGGFHVFAGILKDDAGVVALDKSPGGRITAVQLDVCDPRSITRACAVCGDGIAALDVLINNAGVHLKSDRVPLEEMTFDDYIPMMQVNAIGPLRVTKEFLPLLKKGVKRLIINISSEAGSVSQSTRTSEFGYCMTKAALNMQSKILQNHLKPEGFKVLAVHPGWMRTFMVGHAPAAIDPAVPAAGIFDLAQRTWKPEDPIYMDYTGKEFTW